MGAAYIYEADLRCDFNGDFKCDGGDIDELQASLVGGSPDPDVYDLTGDSQVDVNDRNSWLELAGTLNYGAPYLLGDANLDGSVDTSDFNIWNENRLTNRHAWTSGDFNVDGSVDVSDFNLWNGSKFTGSQMLLLTNPLNRYFAFNLTEDAHQDRDLESGKGEGEDLIESIFSRW